MLRHASIALLACTTLIATSAAQTTSSQRVPGATWERFVDPADAGFDATKLEAARASWEALPSSAFMVIADGAVVVAWGDVERRFMCHSVRKSFMAALYGIYWDRGEIQLNKTLADLGIDDEPDPLLPIEKTARILDLLKARSGVFHTAAYAGRTDSAERGSKGPGTYFAYNNWDFNTLATILEQETGCKTFEAFDEFFGGPLGMEDWRVSDGYYHYQRHLSKYPAYPFRMSARDAARFGLLFTRFGLWGDERILSEHWVQRCSALYSIDDAVRGYGFMWWIFREPRFTKHGMYSALGVGNQMIAALPKSDIVIVNRANTYEGEGTPGPALLNLIEEVLNARTGTSVAQPKLAPLESAGVRSYATTTPAAELQGYVGEWSFPPASLGLPSQMNVQITAADGHAVVYIPRAGTFSIYRQPDGSFVQEDSERMFIEVRDAAGAFDGFADLESVLTGAIVVAGRGDEKQARELLKSVFRLREGLSEEQLCLFDATGILVDLVLDESATGAEDVIYDLAEQTSQDLIESSVNDLGYQLMRQGNADAASRVFTVNARVFYESANAWDSLGEAQAARGAKPEAIQAYERALELDPSRETARTALARLRGE